MSDLINRIKCPMGCNNAIFTETTKIINEGKSPLLLEGNSPKTIIKVYKCQCCGNVFEMKQANTSGKVIL